MVYIANLNNLFKCMCAESMLPKQNDIPPQVTETGHYQGQGSRRSPGATITTETTGTNVIALLLY